MASAGQAARPATPRPRHAPAPASPHPESTAKARRDARRSETLRNGRALWPTPPHLIRRGDGLGAGYGRGETDGRWPGPSQADGPDGKGSGVMCFLRKTNSRPADRRSGVSAAVQNTERKSGSDAPACNVRSCGCRRLAGDLASRLRPRIPRTQPAVFLRDVCKATVVSTLRPGCRAFCPRPVGWRGGSDAAVSEGRGIHAHAGSRSPTLSRLSLVAPASHLPRRGKSGEGAESSVGRWTGCIALLTAVATSRCCSPVRSPVPHLPWH